MIIFVILITIDYICNIDYDKSLAMESQKHECGDDIFEEIFGYKPKKRGEGYEIIVACVLQHLNSNATVSHDERLRTEKTKSVYQLDAVVRDLDGEVMVEAKDYKGSVERDVVAKVCGDMTALKIKNAIIATPNGYTKGAVNYPQDVKDHKNIDLWAIRKAKDSDYTLPSGSSTFITELRFVLSLIGAIYERGKFDLILKMEDMEDIKNMLRKTGKTSINRSYLTDRFYKSDGSEVLASIMSDEIDKKHTTFPKGGHIEGEWIPSEDLYVKVDIEGHELIQIDKIKYKIPTYRGDKIENTVFRYTPPVLLIKRGTEDKDENYRMIDKNAILDAYPNIKLRRPQ